MEDVGIRCSRGLGSVYKSGEILESVGLHQVEVGDRPVVSAKV